MTSTSSTSLTITTTSTQQLTATSTINPYEGSFVVSATGTGYECRGKHIGPYVFQTGGRIAFRIQSTIPIDVFLMNTNQYNQWEGQTQCAVNSAQWVRTKVTAYLVPESDPITVTQGGEFYFLFLNYNRYYDASVSFLLQVTYPMNSAATQTLTSTTTLSMVTTITGIQGLLGSFGQISQDQLIILVGAIGAVVLVVVLIVGRRR